MISFEQFKGAGDEKKSPSRISQCLQLFFMKEKTLADILHGDSKKNCTILIISYLRIALGGCPNSSEKEREK